METPPPTPPTVQVQGADIAVSYYEWTIDDRPVTFKAAEKQEDVELSVVQLSEGDTLEVTVESPVMPADFVIATFDDVDSTGQPVESSATETDCLRDQDHCDVRSGDHDLTASLKVGDHRPAIIVVHLVYVAEEQDGTMGHLVGSWGARIAG